MKLKRKKVGDRSYDLINVSSGQAIANASQTGEHGRDNYPWSWHLLGDRIFGKLGANTGRSVESLRDAVDAVESSAREWGLYLPLNVISGYSVKEGQLFRYGGYYYRALEDAHGEFNAYVQVNNYRGENIEIIIRHGDNVIPYGWEAE